MHLALTTETFDTYTLGFKIGLGFGIFLLLVLAVAAILGLSKRDDRYGDGRMIGVFGAGSFVIVAVIMVLITWPWEREYHGYTTVDGTVAQVDSRLLPDGDSMQEKFVVLYDNGKQYGCEDTRCASVAPGDVLRLNCQLKYDWGGTDGWDCKFLGLTKATQ